MKSIKFYGFSSFMVNTETIVNITLYKVYMNFNLVILFIENN